MIKVELIYNPYVMETTVKFNDRTPHVNSLVEKYQKGKLQDWISKIPHIFYDEMNGYDFELEFSGPRTDYEQIVKAFSDAGVGEEQVKLFHKNELSSREDKVKVLRALMKWLKEEPNNELFDFAAFSEENREVLETEYTFISINGEGLESPFEDSLGISIEDVASIDELEGVDLSNVPIVIYVTKDFSSKLQTIISDINRRTDIDDKQLFFVISHEINKDMIMRTITDLGIRQLQVVDSIRDQSIMDYYYTYPVTEQLRLIIDVLSKKCDLIGREVNRRREKSEKTNSEIYEMIDDLDRRYSLLKDALIRLQSRDNLEEPAGCVEAYDKLVNDIESWRKNKVKFSEEYAEKNARDFNKHVHKLYGDFILTINKVISEEQEALVKDYGIIYSNAQNDDYKVESTFQKVNKEFPTFVTDLLMEKEEKYVLPKAGLKEQLFGDENREEKEAVLITTYYCQEWRKKALEIAIPIAREIIQGGYEQLNNNVTGAAEEYISRLEMAIDNNIEKKAGIVSKLSDDESRLQDDIKWSTTFGDEVMKLREVRK